MLLIRHRFIMPRTFISRAQKANAAIVRNQQQVFHSMLGFLAKNVSDFHTLRAIVSTTIIVGGSSDQALGHL